MSKEEDMRISGKTAPLRKCKRRPRNLKETEWRLAQFSLDKAGEAIVWFRPDATYAYVNDAACRLLGYSRDEILNMTVHDINPALSREVWKGYWERLRQQEVLSYEASFRTKDGHTIPVEVTANYLQYEGREYSCGFARDMTDRKRSQEAAAVNEARWEGLQRIMRHKAVDLQALLDFVLEEAIRLTESRIGYIYHYHEERQEFVLNNWSDGVMSECTIQEKQTVYQLEKTGLWGEAVRQRRPIVVNDFQSEHPLKRGYPQGHAPLHRFMTIPVFSHGRIVSVVGVGNKETDYDEADVRQLVLMMDSVWNITELKLAEEALKESEERYRQIAENIREVFWIADVELTRMIYISPAYEEVWGQSCSSLYADPKSWFQAIHPHDREKVSMALLERVAGGYAVEYRIMHPDGTVRWVLDRGFPVFDRNGKVYRVAGIAEDITARKRAEEEKGKLEAQLRQKQKMEAIGTLAAGIAHDFNNILGAILGFTELVRDEIPEGISSHRDLGQVLNAANRAKDLVRQILSFCSQGEPLEMRLVDLGPIVLDALRLLRATLPSTIELRERIASGLGWVMADPTQIHQVLVNLCTNAAHAMRENGGVMEVSMAETELNADAAGQSAGLKPGSYLSISVSDTGHGMDDATVERIFDPYYTTKRVGEGSGLGLAVVHGIVQRHEGAITVSSERGKGTVFRVLFPRVEMDEREKKSVSAAASVQGGSEHILFVDDEEDLGVVGGRMLTRLGYKVTFTTSSLEAVLLFRSQPDAFDLVLTDYTMPHLTGIDLAKEILLVRPDIPIVMCTGFSESMNAEKSRLMGISEFILKPLDAKILSGVIRKALDRER